MPSHVIPLPRTPALLVQHAAQALRAGEAVTVKAPAGEIRVLSAETAKGGDRAPPRGASLVLTGQRLASIVDVDPAVAAWRIPLEPGTSPSALTALVDPTAPADPEAAALVRHAVPAGELAERAIELCKLAGLMPAAICLRPSIHPNGITLLSSAIRDHRRLEALGLHPVSEARVPLADAENARIVAFRPADGGPEQLAIIVGEPEDEAAPLCRLHSECFTGDLLGSLRCDCGDQLRGAIRRMAGEGAGVLLYLAQEGRGIGLTNKLRAYTLQDSGLDTVDANTHLGFAPDERQFRAAATMLKHLGITRVRLLTNNPLKLEQLAAYGIEVAGRVAHSFASNEHNQGYLRTKALRSGHLLEPEKLIGKGANGARYGHG